MTTATAVADYDKVLSTVHEIVKEFGRDYVYQKVTSWRTNQLVCNYFVAGQPSCIVGHVLNRLFGTTDAGAFEGTNAYHYLSNAWGDRFTGKARLFLNNVQRHQDDGVEWGTCLRRAMEDMAGFEEDGLRK